MLLVIENLLDAAALGDIRAALVGAAWADGGTTAGPQSRVVKANRQLPETDVLTPGLQARVAAALAASALFQAAALPHRIVPAMFSRYDVGDAYGAHVDNAIRRTVAGDIIRTDISATLFLSDPADYDGGELVVEDGSINQRSKLPAGSLLLYPATSRHYVTPVTRGSRMACVFWVQSLVADAARRAILFDIDLAIQSLRPRVGDQDAALLALTGAYHNLLRQWATL